MTATDAPLPPESRYAGRIFVVWGLLALLALWPAAALLDGAFPILTLVWVLVPLGAFAARRDPARVGFRPIPWQTFVRTTGVALGVSFAIVLAFEPWSHTYERLIELATSTSPLDTTFAWLVRYPRPLALAAMTAYAGLVTMFGEELFFRGWLLQGFRRRMSPWRAIALQAALFAVPNMLVATVMSPLQGAIYVFVYAFVSVGIVGGWAASRTGSIWPSLTMVTLGNLILVGLLA